MTDRFDFSTLAKCPLALVCVAVLTAYLTLADRVMASGKSLDSAMRAAHSQLQKGGSGLVDRYEACPQNDQSEWGYEYITAIELKPVDAVTDAVLMDTGQCSGGNQHGQYLAIASPSGARLVLTNVIGDMRFIADRFFVDEGVLRVSGMRWLEDDPHCCPSERGTVQFNLQSGETAYQRD